VIYTCKGRCTHDGQDRLHGKGRRVLNHVPGGQKKPEEFRCTVCRTVHSASDVNRRGG
jgi:hypothetical protein